MSSASVLLVQMPYGGLGTPSPALGLLKAILVRAGIATEARYPNLEFGDEIGPGYYERISRESAYLIGEWSFAGAAFPDFHPDHDRYLKRLGPSYPAPEKLLALRANAEAFVGRISEQIVASKPRIVACTSMFHQHSASLALLRMIRNLDPSIITMVGGANCEGVMGWTTLQRFPWVDIVVSGEADGLVVALCEKLLAQGPDLGLESMPKGVFGRVHRKVCAADTELCCSNGKPREDPVTALRSARAVFDRLDTNPIPDYDDYFAALASAKTGAAITPGIPIETSRGCWWGAIQHCTFCGLNGGSSNSMSYRSKPPQGVANEFVTLAQRYGIRRFTVVDNILNMSYFRDVLPELAALPEKVTFFHEVKANLSKEQLKLLVAAGGMWLQPGFESLDDEPLLAMKKGTTAAINIQFLKWARELGIFLFWSVLHGIPGEQAEWYSRMCELVPKLAHLQPPMQVGPILFHRFSPYHTRSDEYGLKLVPSWPYFWIYPIDHESMCDLVYCFDDSHQTGLGPGEVFEAELPSRSELPYDYPQELPQGDLRGRFSPPQPYVLALRAACAQWRKRFYSPLPPILSMGDSGGTLRIVDTRPCAVTKTTDLTGIDRQLYLACDRASTMRGILQEMEKQGGEKCAEEQLGKTLEMLIRRNLLVKLGERYLALAVAGEVPSLSPKGYPAGLINRFYGRAKPVRKEQAPPVLAVSERG